jgi:hypothetical protein
MMRSERVAVVSLGLSRNRCGVGPAAQEGLTLGIADDLAAIGEALNVRVDGLIGFDFIKDFRMTIATCDGKCRE